MTENRRRRLTDNLKRESDNVTWWTGNSTRVWRCSMLALMSIVSFLSSWLFLTVVEFPARFVIRNDYLISCGRIEDKLDRINEHLLEIYRMDRDKNGRSN